MRHICPICGKPFESSAQKGDQGGTNAFPFCSRRCRLIDLGAWLDGEYRIPARENPESDNPDG